MIELSPTAAQAAPGVFALAIAAFGWIQYRRAKKDVERRADERRIASRSRA